MSWSSISDADIVRCAALLALNYRDARHLYAKDGGVFLRVPPNVDYNNKGQERHSK